MIIIARDITRKIPIEVSIALCNSGTTKVLSLLESANYFDFLGYKQASALSCPVG